MGDCKPCYSTDYVDDVIITSCDEQQSRSIHYILKDAELELPSSSRDDSDEYTSVSNLKLLSFLRMAGRRTRTRTMNTRRMTITLKKTFELI